MKQFQNIIWFGLLFSFLACGRMPQHAPEANLEEAKTYYDSGFVCLQQDSLLQAIPHFIHVADNLEYPTEDMTGEEMLLASRAYYQMAYVFRLKIESNAEIDALRWALGYQQTVQDTTWMIRSSLQLANAFSTLKENDSARYYLDFVTPYLDTVSDDLNNYFIAQHVLSDIYYNQHQFDSCFMVQRNTMAFKTRRGMGTANDSVSLGICMYHSPYRLESKPYLLKVLAIQTGDVERGAIMSLLEQIYEEEGNSDSVTFCHSFNKTYVQAESDRVSDGMLAVKQYENYKSERDRRLADLREQKIAQKAKVLRAVCVIVALLLLAAVAFVLYHRTYRKRMTQEHEEIKRDLQAAHGALEAQAQEALRVKVQAIYDDKRNNTMGRIREVFNEAYPDALTKLKAAHPDLNETELDICVLSMFPFRTKEIADILDLRENTVSKYRTTIKKKTQADSFEALWKRFLV